MFVNMLKPYLAKRTVTDGTVSYSNGVSAGMAMAGDVSYDYDETPLYGDGARVDSGKEIIGGKVKLGVTRLPLPVRALIGGHTYTAAVTGTNATPEKMVVKKGDKPNELGLGFITIEEDEAKATHIYANVYPRLQFSTPNFGYKTKENKKSYQTPTAESDMLDSTDHIFEDITEHATESAAEAYIKAALSIT